MKANQNVGRIELLQWINEFTECDYPKLEMCCDAVGYCQVLDAIHPGIINLQKLSFSAKYPDDYSRNLKVLDEAFNKLEIEKVVPIDKLKQGKFQDNMRFLQWLYTYANRTGPVNLRSYKGYERRMEAIAKQKAREAMSPHLVPNKAFLKFKSKKFSQFGDLDAPNSNNPQMNSLNQMNQMEMPSQQKPLNVFPGFSSSIEDKTGFTEENMGMNMNINPNSGNNNKVTKKILQFEEYLRDLEGDLKTKMEYNWKLMYAIEDMLYQRSTLYNILIQIEGLAQKNQGSEFKETLLNIVTYTPNDFKQEEDLK